MPGKVYLVGAGPGDPELLTLKAVRAIARADVLLVDDLVNDAILEHARADARIIHVGKRGGCKSTPQAFIEKLMINEARAGHTVVRLKGGDPMIFGRGGEERAHLMAEGLEVEVINGITSGLLAATSIGVPLTHRDDTHGVILVTGHGKSAEEGEARVDWRALAATGLTLVIYMGMAKSEFIRSELLAAGLRTSLPVAIVTSAGTQTQRAVVTDLGGMIDSIAEHGLKSPGIIIVGDVVRHADAAQLESTAQDALTRRSVG
jgi:uroporphyrin-III C-methyltransferase